MIRCFAVRLALLIGLAVFCYSNASAQIAAGGNFTSAVLPGGAVWSWGWNNLGQIGDGTFTGRSTPVQVTQNLTDPLHYTPLTNVSAIANGNAHAIAVWQGTVVSWGYNGNGQLGDGGT